MASHASTPPRRRADPRVDPLTPARTACGPASCRRPPRTRTSPSAELPSSRNARTRPSDNSSYRVKARSNWTSHRAPPTRSAAGGPGSPSNAGRTRHPPHSIRSSSSIRWIMNRNEQCGDVPAGRLEGISEVTREALPQRPSTARTDVDAITLEPGGSACGPARRPITGHARRLQPLRQAKSADARTMTTTWSDQSTIVKLLSTGKTVDPRAAGTVPGHIFALAGG